MKEPLAKITKDLFLKFNNIEEQKKLEHEFLFDITSMCNLNCTNCSVFCGLREPYFITVEDFRKQLKNLRKKVPARFISLCGGEPTMHPQFMELCKEVFRQVPDCFLQIITNGTLLDQFSDEDLKLFSKYKVAFSITLYPKIEYINMVQNFEKKCNTYFPEIDVSVKGIRPYFGKYDYNYKGNNDPDDYYYFCEKSHQCHSFVIFKNRIYNCCLSPDYCAIDLPMHEEDSYSMDALPSYEEILNFGNHSYNSCRYCSNQTTLGQPLHFWHQQHEVESNYIGSLLNLYTDNYDTYHKLLHTFGEIPQCLQNEYFLSKNDKESHAACDPVSHFKKRFTDGIADIFIPYDENCNILKCEKQIYSLPNLHKYNIYLVSLNAGKKAEEIVYNVFTPLKDTKNSFWFLKANNIEEGLKIFSDVSFLNKKIIVINYNLLNDFNLLLNSDNVITKEELQQLFE